MNCCVSYFLLRYTKFKGQIEYQVDSIPTEVWSECTGILAFYCYTPFLFMYSPSTFFNIPEYTLLFYFVYLCSLVDLFGTKGLVVGVLLVNLLHNSLFPWSNLGF